MYFRISLSEAHAKLSLRTKVFEEDALIAILLYESSLTLKHGKAYINFPCPNYVSLKVHTRSSSAGLFLQNQASLLILSHSTRL